ncbi:MAG: hypothetical protein JXJ17_13590 [Anaerolineae bacterium]|nr:hypothetical protein [Anaerolineae bacterium]
MENSRRRNYWIDVALFVLMLITFFSLAGHRGADVPGGQSVVHCIAGAALFILAVRHLGSHIDWIRKVYTTRRKDLPRKVRTRRRNDLLLFIWITACGASGLVMWISGYNEVLSHLHKITGVLASFTMLLHVGYHARWLVRATRCYVFNGGRKVPQEQPVGADSLTAK